MRRLAIILLLAAALPAEGKLVSVPTLQEILSGKIYPLTLMLKDLDREWRRLSVSGQPVGSAWPQAYLSLLSGQGVYYTKGEVVTLSGETYLVAYRPQVKGPSPLDLMRMRPDQLPPPPPLELGTPLALSLLNLRTAGSLNDIRPFDLQQEIAAAQTAQQTIEESELKAQEAASLSNLKQITLALLMYVQDYDEVLPPMDNPAAVKTRLLPYVRNENLFICPRTKEPYSPNPALSLTRLGDYPNPAETVTFYEATPMPDNTRAAAFLDGHVKRMAESQWAQVRAQIRQKPIPTSESRLKQLGLALRMYAQDYDEMLPPMQDAKTAQAALWPYVKNRQVFLQPATGQPYLPNRILSLHRLAHISLPADTVAFYEQPAPDGSRRAVFVDGSIRLLSRDEWERVKRISKID